MNLFGREVDLPRLTFAKSAAPTAIKPNDAKKGIEIGDTGTRILGGIILDEYNTKLIGHEGILVYDEMRKSDGTVRALVSAVSLPIRAAHWYIKPASEDADDIAIAEFVEECLFERASITFDDVLRQALLMLPFGVMVFEKVFTTEDFAGQTRIIWEKLAPRMPKSIYKWAINSTTPQPGSRETGFERGITQIRSDGSLAEIPLNKLLVFCNEQEGENWWGTSILRAAYKHWFIKNTFYKIDAIAFERQGLGVPYVKMPDGFTEADRAKAETILKNLRANSTAFIIEPSDYEIGFKDMMAQTTRDPATSIAHHNREIMKSALAQFIELGGSSGSGSRAVSQDHSALFLKSLEACATNIASTFNKYAIKQLVDLNFVTVDYPTLEYSGITETDVAALATTYQTLANAGGLQAGTVDEQYFRELLGMPEREDDDVIEKPQPPATMVPVIGPDGKPVMNPDGTPQMQPAPAVVTPPVTKPKPGDNASPEDTDIEPDNTQDEDINDDLGLSEFIPALKKKVYPERKEIRAKLEASIKDLPIANALALTKGRIGLVHLAEKGPHAAYYKNVNKELHEILSELRRKAFAEDNAFKGYRPLTFAEQKVDFQSIQKTIDQLEGQFSGEVQALMKDALDTFMRDLTLAVHDGNTEGVKTAAVQVEAELSKIIKNAATSAYAYGKGNVSKEIGVKTPANNADIIAQISIQADTIAKQQVAEITSVAKNALTEAVNKGATSTSALGAAAAAAEDTVAALANDTANIMMAGYVNTGRNDVMSANADNLYALQRSELLDNHTCNFCLSIDGRIIDVNDPFGQNTIFHSGCRGIWVAILNNEAELPPITDIPQSIRDRFGDTVNDLIQPKKPITRKDSPARKEAQRRAQK